MKKFQPGQRVRVVASAERISELCILDLSTGDVGRVKRSTRGDVYVAFGGGTWWLGTSDLEPADTSSKEDEHGKA